MSKHSSTTKPKKDTKTKLDPDFLKRIEQQKKIIQDKEDALKQQNLKIAGLHAPETNLSRLESSTPSKYRRLGSFAGLKLYENRVEQSGRTYSIPIQNATIEISINGQIYTTTDTSGGTARPTLTRVATGAMLGGGLGALIGMTAQKQEGITSKSTVHDLRKGVIAVGDGNLQVSGEFDPDKENQAAEFAAKFWEAKAHYPEALAKREREAEQIQQEIEDTKQQIEDNKPLIEEEEAKLPAFQQNIQAAKDGLDGIIASAPPEQQKAYHHRETKHGLLSLLAIVVIAALVIWGFVSCGTHSDNNKQTAYSQIQGETWDKAKQTLKNAGVDTTYGIQLHDVSGQMLYPVSGQENKYTVKKVDGKDQSKPTITLHIDVPESLKGQTWDKAKQILDAKNFTVADYSIKDVTGNPLILLPTSKTNVYTVKAVDNNKVPATLTLHADIPESIKGQSWDKAQETLTTQGYDTTNYKLIGTDSKPLSVPSGNAAQWNVEQVDNTTAPATLLLKQNGQAAPATSTQAAQPQETMGTIQQWYSSEAAGVCFSYGHTLEKQVFKKSLGIKTNVHVAKSQGVFDHMNGAYISCSYTSDVNYNINARFLATYPDTGNIQLAQAAAYDPSGNKAFDDNYINGWDMQAVNTFNTFKAKYPTGDFKDQYGNA